MKCLLFSIMAMLALGAQAGVEAVKNMQAPEEGKSAVLSFGGEGGREFLLDGVPFQIRSGEMHPQRIPRSHWRHRIRAAKAMGLNTIAFYTFWNGIEQEAGSWDFTGRNDIAAFIDMCQEEGMWVLFRPGPYVCGEWTLGGLPSYLLKEEVTPLRFTGNKKFMKAQTRYLEKMAEVAIPRLSKNGGPILMVQLENEYGSYKSEHDELAYIEWLKDFWTKKGAGPLYLSEGSASHHLRFVPKGVAVGLDPADNAAQMQTALHVAPGVPIFSSETYPGWLRHWGEGNWTATNKSETMRWYMRDGVSFNLFVLHGGTNFGLTAGANTNPDGSRFEPDLTSYDYGSPIGENGTLMDEYFQYRDIIKAALPEEAAAKLPEPVQPKAMEIPAFKPVKVCGFHEVVANRKKRRVATPPTLESLGQNQGVGIYYAKLPAGPAATLHCKPHDYALVYVGKRFIGTMDRRANQTTIELPERKVSSVLKIVVDTFGHVNFSKFMEKDRKGLIGKVMLGDKEVKGWSVSAINLANQQPEKVSKDKYARLKEQGGLYRAEIQLENPIDTFLDMLEWQKGYVWVNGHLLGRYWNIGPQERLYCPGEFLKSGTNVIEILDFHVTTDTPPAISGKTQRNMEVRKETKSLNNQW